MISSTAAGPETGERSSSVMVRVAQGRWPGRSTIPEASRADASVTPARTGTDGVFARRCRGEGEWSRVTRFRWPRYS
ncbi:hypothetical protein HNR21_001494 [Actinomadura cellulosilytica]|uniref:Uncharacterized protein n=1 Tax=Thermomonospora cellulosilytica TaxID=1411118 RepID=A0A7W3R7F1_9ACTN|nr:hypothetical protein [Thermomonospora cellulosilytica]